MYIYKFDLNLIKISVIYYISENIPVRKYIEIEGRKCSEDDTVGLYSSI